MATETHEIGRVRYRAEYTRFGDRVTGALRFPSGSIITYEVDREGHSNLWDHGGDDLKTAEDVAAADELFPFSGEFRRASQTFIVAAWVASGVDRAAPGTPWVPSEIDRAETLAMLELEGTPLRDRHRVNRICLECGSPVYGEFCTHCPEC